MNDLTEETNDDQYVCEFHETSKKYTTLKDLFSKAKFRLKLVGLSSIPIAQDIERTKFFCDVNIVTLKKFYSEEKMLGSSLTRDISLKIKEKENPRVSLKKNTGKRHQ